MTTIKIISSALIFVLLLGYSSKTRSSKTLAISKAFVFLQKDTTLNGLYQGLEYMGITTDPVYPGKKFKSYHLGYLKIKDDSVFLDQSPIFVYKKDTTYSASDGGFYYYSGTLQRNDTTVFFNLKHLFCDYCPIRVKKNFDGTEEIVGSKKQLKGRLTNKGIIINGYLYSRTTKNKDLNSEHPKPY